MTFLWTIKELKDPTTGFRIALKRKTAQESLEEEISQGDQIGLNAYASQELMLQGIDTVKPYTFYKNSLLITKIEIQPYSQKLIIDPFEISNHLQNPDKSQPVYYNALSAYNAKGAWAIISCFAWLQNLTQELHSKPK